MSGLGMSPELFMDSSLGAAGVSIETALTRQVLTDLGLNLRDQELI
jgi:hypothetical protein